MCDPITLGIASLAVGVGGQVAGGISSANASKKQAKAEQAAAARAFTQTVADIEAARDEATRAALGERAQMLTISAREKGAAQTVAAEAGVVGTSPEQVQGQLDRALSIALGFNVENLKLKNKQLDREIEGAAAGAQSRINQAKAGVIPGSVTAVQIASGTANSVLSAIPYLQYPGGL